ncbi:hypothetical protein NDU88_005231 [Pleurodeles waltl]|uniref:Uncharacterized protein n=1 Tax=Pleurodeles waltl TaxID=8319 RepID=A0AAV7NLV1_PLEWA|nr:hypothetical protein NDU88_005231 [Pleurodeles waltl]
MESRSPAHSTQRAGIHDRWRALSPVQGAPHRVARSTSASPIPVTAILHCCYFGRERSGDPARPAPSPQSTFRHLSNARVRSAAPILLMDSSGALVQSGHVWGPGLQPRRGGPDQVAILFLLGRATERARGPFWATSSPQLGPQGVGNPLERSRQRRRHSRPRHIRADDGGVESALRVRPPS